MNTRVPYVDYTLLRADSTDAEFKKLCLEALQSVDVVRSVCVLPDPAIIKLCKRLLFSSPLIVCVVNDFPLGRGGFGVKTELALIAKEAGADEIDTVINSGLLKEGRVKEVLQELLPVAMLFPERMKVIIETGHAWYTEELVKKASRLVAEAGAFCVKTSSGFIDNIPAENKVNHARWMHEAAPNLKIKITGGIKTKEQAELFYKVVPAEKLIFGASSAFWK